MWSQLYNAPEGKKGVSKDNGFLYKKNEKGEWRLVLRSRFNMNGTNYLEDAIKEAHDATAHGGVEKTLKYLTDRFICQPFSRLVMEYMASCNTCQRRKYSNKPPLGQVTMLHVLARAWTDITMDFLKMSSVFTYCSTLYSNIPLEDDHMICFSQLWTIVFRQSGFMFLIPVSNNLTAEKCTDTFDTNVASLLVILIILFLIETLSLCQTISRIGQQERESSWNRLPHTNLRRTVSQKLPTRQSSKPHERARSKETYGCTNSLIFSSS